MNQFRELKRHIEFYSGRVIQVYRCSDRDRPHLSGGWIAKYSLSNGEMTSTGCVYERASQAIEEVRVLVTADVNREYLHNRCQELIDQLKSEGFSPDEILKVMAELVGGHNK